MERIGIEMYDALYSNGMLLHTPDLREFDYDLFSKLETELDQVLFIQMYRNLKRPLIDQLRRHKKSWCAR